MCGTLPWVPDAEPSAPGECFANLHIISVKQVLTNIKIKVSLPCTGATLHVHNLMMILPYRRKIVTLQWNCSVPRRCGNQDN